MSKSHFFKPFDYFHSKEADQKTMKEPFGSTFTEDLPEDGPGNPLQARTGPSITGTWSNGPDGGADWDF